MGLCMDSPLCSRFSCPAETDGRAASLVREAVQSCGRKTRMPDRGRNKTHGFVGHKPCRKILRTARLPPPRLVAGSDHAKIGPTPEEKAVRRRRGPEAASG